MTPMITALTVMDPDSTRRAAIVKFPQIWVTSDSIDGQRGTARYEF
jgi:hypothetical protein